MRETDQYNSFMEDCIHLHACRMVARRYKNAGCKFVARGCNDSCRCYQQARKVYLSNYISHEDAADVARRQYDGPNDPYDVYCAWDFDGYTSGEAFEIINGSECTSDWQFECGDA